MSLFTTLMGGLLLAVAASMLLTMVRLLRGPSVPDRAVAFDLLMLHVVVLIAIYAMVVGATVLLDSIIVVAVLGFLGTVALARYLEEGRS